MKSIYVNPTHTIQCEYKESVAPWFLQYEYPGIIVFLVLPIMLLLSLSGRVREIISYGCGVKISLFYGASPIKEKEYRFTKDKEKDVKKIREIIKEFEKIGNDSYNSDELRKIRQQKEKEACCNQFKERINEVVPE